MSIQNAKFIGISSKVEREEVYRRLISPSILFLDSQKYHRVPLIETGNTVVVSYRICEPVYILLLADGHQRLNNCNKIMFFTETLNWNFSFYKWVGHLGVGMMLWLVNIKYPSLNCNQYTSLQYEILFELYSIYCDIDIVRLVPEMCSRSNEGFLRPG